MGQRDAGVLAGRGQCAHTGGVDCPGQGSPFRGLGGVDLGVRGGVDDRSRSAQ